MVLANANEVVPLTILAQDGTTTAYGQFRVYDNVGGLVTTLNADHLVDGIYQVNWTPTTQGYFSVVGQLYTDVARTIPTLHGISGDTVDVSDVKSNILRLLGLQHHNSVIDQTVYDTNGQLLTARVRGYNSKIYALAAGVTGLISSYTITAEYAGAHMTKYTMVADF